MSSQLTAIKRTIVQEVKAVDFSLNVSTAVNEARMCHGLRHKDYELYRQYCCRRIRRIRKRLDMRQGGKKFAKRDLNVDNFRNEGLLELLLLQVERSWAYAMQLKEQSEDDDRKKYAFRNKLRKADQHAQHFETLVESSGRCDERTQLEVEGYCAWLRGTVAFELADLREEWEKPIKHFETATVIYTSLLNTLSEEERNVIQGFLSEVSVMLRYCRHKSGDANATSSLLTMTENDALGDKLSTLLSKAREKKAATLTEVSWKGRTLPVKHEKVRHFLSKEREEEERSIEQIEKLLAEGKDALALVREDCNSEPSFKVRQAASSGPVSSLHMLHSYLTYLKLGLMLRRNVAMLREKSAQLAEPTKGVRPPKETDLVRLYDLCMTALQEMTLLAGLEDDQALKTTNQRRSEVFRACRCFHVASTYAKQEKWLETLVLLERASERAAKIQGAQPCDQVLLDEMLSKLEAARCQAKAEALKARKAPVVTKPGQTCKKVLADRLEQFVVDGSLLQSHNNPRVVTLPPPLLPVPTKPLFFDLALNHIGYPDLKHKLPQQQQAADKAQETGGLTGMVKGLWSWGAKK